MFTDHKSMVLIVGILATVSLVSILHAGLIYCWQPDQDDGTSGQIVFTDDIEIGDDSYFSMISIKTFSFSNTILPDWSLNDLGKVKAMMTVTKKGLISPSSYQNIYFTRVDESIDNNLAFSYDEKGLWNWKSDKWYIKDEKGYGTNGSGRWVLQNVAVPAPSAFLLVLAGIGGIKTFARRRTLP